MRKLSERIRELIVYASYFFLKFAYIRKPFREFSLSDQEVEEKIRAHIPNKEAIFESLSNQGLIATPKHDFISQRLEERLDTLGAKLCLTDKVSAIDWSHGYVLTAVVLKELRQDFNGVVLDFGTARGFSAIALAEAIRESDSNLPVVTMDILPHDEKMFWNSPIDRNGRKSRSEIWNQLDAGDNIIFLEGPISQSLKMLGMNRIRLAFLDSQHSQQQVETELSYVSARQKSGDLIVLDDFGSSGFHGVVAGARSVFSKNNYSKEAEVSSLYKTVAVWKKQ